MAAILEPLHRNLRLRGRTPGAVLVAAAQRFHQSTEQFIQTLSKAGVDPATYRARLRADLVRQALAE
jgi:hypothetical protein